MRKINNDTEICLNCKYCEKGYLSDGNKLFCNNPVYEKKFVEFYNINSIRQPRYYFGALDQKNRGKKVKYRDTCKYYESLGPLKRPLF